MLTPELWRSLARPASTKLVLLVFDGLGGLPRNAQGDTELEHAECPNLDRLAAGGITGLHQPVGWGVTPGSGPGHLALFGYDPVEHQIGRGALSALGVNVPLAPGDIAIRLNFSAIDESGNIDDRRAGRISTVVNRALIERLRDITVSGVSITFAAEREHRAILVLRGEGLDPRVSATDPQRDGVPPLAPLALHPAAARTADVLTKILARVREALADQSPANFLLMRGYGTAPMLPSLADRHGLRAACLAVYPMYRGLGKAVGMTIIDTGESFREQLNCLRECWQDFDFFFIHVKATDTRGEDGDFEGKASLISEVDSHVPSLTDLAPDVLVVTGDHSTPATMRSHSWHPVPFLLSSPQAMRDQVTTFGERACARGGLGIFPATAIMPLMLAHGDRLQRFGA